MHSLPSFLYVLLKQLPQFFLNEAAQFIIRCDLKLRSGADHLSGQPGLPLLSGQVPKLGHALFYIVPIADPLPEVPHYTTDTLALPAVFWPVASSTVTSLFLMYTLALVPA